MKKIDLITGFLGSGKTTFIKEYVKYLVSIGEKVCILENDFGAINVDMMLLSELRGENVEIEMVSGGCDNDCHRRRFKTKLIAMGMDDYTRIIVEPSGVFDTDEFFDALYDEPLCNWYEISNVIAIVDANVEDTLSENSKYMLASEVACAGKIVLSKVQDYTKEQIAATKEILESILHDINCNREISDAFFTKDWKSLTISDYEMISNSGYVKSSFVKRVIDPNEAYDTVFIMDKKPSIEKIREISRRLFDDSKCGNVFRIKGFVCSDEGYFEINFTKKETRINIIPEGQDVVIIIGENLNTDYINSIM